MGAEEWDADITAVMTAGSTRWSACRARWTGCARNERRSAAAVRGGFWGGAPSSGNHAFDEYRTETLKRLEEEQREFREFLERLRFAKDKTEFDAFMAERRNRPARRSSRRSRTEFSAYPRNGRFAPRSGRPFAFLSRAPLQNGTANHSLTTISAV